MRREFRTRLGLDLGNELAQHVIEQADVFFCESAGASDE
jgi:hypothetical protein